MSISDMQTGPSDLIINSPTVMRAFVVALGGGLVYLSFLNRKRLTALPSPVDVLFDEEQLPKGLPHRELEPLTNFDYNKTSPEIFRPYTPKFSRSLNLQPNDPNNLILLDSTYRRRLAYRRHLLRTHPTETSGHLPAASTAVSEFYTYLISSHLPTRFPRHFSKSPSGTLVQNHTTTNTYPIIPQSTPNALRALAENLDEDFLFLLPSPDSLYRVGAFVTCFPNGYSLADNLGHPLSASPLDRGLSADIQRFFTKLAPGVENGVCRLNWSIASSDELYTPNGDNDRRTPTSDDEDEDVEFKVEKCQLRVERQTMWKLPSSGAVVMGVKTYLYPLAELKGEDGGAEGRRLADAIESVGDELGPYKARGQWGRLVVEYLRS